MQNDKQPISRPDTVAAPLEDRARMVFAGWCILLEETSRAAGEPTLPLPGPEGQLFLQNATPNADPETLTKEFDYFNQYCVVKARQAGILQ